MVRETLPLTCDLTCSARIRARSAVGSGIRARPLRQGGSESGVGRNARKSRMEGWPSSHQRAALGLTRHLSTTSARALHTLSRTSPPLAQATANMSDEPRKRSRFDQAEPEPPRRSKFDRRSRSPSKGDGEAATRSRSPVAKSVEGSGPKKDAAAAAAEAAARINAQLSQKKAPQHVDVPPIRAVSGWNGSLSYSVKVDQDTSQTNSPSVAPGSAKSPSATADSGTLNVEIYQQDGDYIKDIEVNDLRNRYTLTKGSTQKMVITHLHLSPLMFPGPACPPFHYHTHPPTSMGLCQTFGKKCICSLLVKTQPPPARSICTS